MNTKARLSAFGDEISDDLSEQIATLVSLNIRFLELRGVWGKNVLELSDAEVDTLRDSCREAGVTVSAIGSPIGKSPIEDPLDNETANLSRALEIADKLDVQSIRVFSFYPPASAVGDQIDDFINESAQRLSALAERAADAGVTLLLENEKGIVGDTIKRTHALLARVDSPTLRFAWDPANFVQVGEASPTEDGWPKLGAYVAHVHIKDAVASGDVRPAGQGDGQVGLLLDHLRDNDYGGYLALEPHLAIAGHSSGFSGVEGMTHAAAALRELMSEHGLPED